MLPAGRHVEEVYTAIVFPAATPGTVLIDCSTIDVGTAKAVAEAAQVKGLRAVDAPVSGGIAAATAGTLTFMVGGAEDAFAAAQPLLAQTGKSVFHVGASGAGQAVKMFNNLVLASNMIAACEAFALAEKLGLDPAKFHEVASVSTAPSWSMNDYTPVPGVGPESPADRGYQGGFAAALMLKDLRLAMAAAADADANVPLGTRATELYASLDEAGGGGSDFSAIIERMR
jgi:3-hydroxyisobutyrate dehydrogenase